MGEKNLRQLMGEGKVLCFVEIMVRVFFIIDNAKIVFLSSLLLLEGNKVDSFKFVLCCFLTEKTTCLL